MFSFSSTPLESVEENYPLNTIVRLNDPKVLKEFKTLLGRKKAIIEFEKKSLMEEVNETEGLFCNYEYEVLQNTGIKYLDKKSGKEKEKREKRLCKGNIFLGECVPHDKVEGFYHSHLNVLWRFSPLDEGNNILPNMEHEKEVPLTKFEFDVIQIDDILFNKNDILKMLQVFKNDITTLYCEEDPAHGVAVFSSSELDIEVFMTTVQEHKNKND